MGSRTKDPGATVPYPSALLCACAGRQGWRLPGRYEGIFIAIPSPWTTSWHPSAPDSSRVAGTHLKGQPQVLSTRPGGLRDFAKINRYFSSRRN